MHSLIAQQTFDTIAVEISILGFAIRPICALPSASTHPSAQRFIPPDTMSVRCSQQKIQKNNNCSDTLFIRSCTRLRASEAGNEKAACRHGSRAGGRAYDCLASVRCSTSCAHGVCACGCLLRTSQQTRANVCSGRTHALATGRAHV